MVTNKQGLGRNIPAATKRQVRQRCGFGCVVCGSAFYQYDHLGTEFKDAEEHDADQLVLLCGSCHDRKTRGVLSTATIQLHAERPKCKENGFSRGPMDIGAAHPEIVMGNFTALNVKSLITIDGESVFSISDPEEPGSPFLVNASLYDKEGRRTLEIVNNEFQTDSSNWDVESVGKVLKIRSALGRFDLAMRVDPPRSIHIERLEMIYKDVAISCKEGRSTILTRGDFRFETTGVTFDGCVSAIDMRGKEVTFGLGGSVRIDEAAIIGMGSTLTIGGAPAALRVVKQGRNDPCQCGSGVKFKRCHGK